MIPRTPEEVIRLKVIDKPLVSDCDFKRAQDIMRRKKQRNWRYAARYQNRQILHGVLRCGTCGGPLYTALAKGMTYYFCRNRQLDKKACEARTQSWIRLQQGIDCLLGNIKEAAFLKKVAAASKAGEEAQIKRSAVATDTCLSVLRTRRLDALDSYVEGIIGPEQGLRDLRGIGSEIAACEATLERKVSPRTPSRTRIAQFFVPFSNWKSLDGKQKRCLLESLRCKIYVDSYRILRISLPAGIVQGDSNGPGVAGILERLSVPGLQQDSVHIMLS